MTEKVLPTPVVLMVGDVIMGDNGAQRIAKGKLTVDADTGAYLEMDECIRVDISEDDAVYAWESGKQVFEVASDFVGLWTGC